MKGKKTGGRVAGTPNRGSLKVEEIASRFGLDPFEVLMMVINNDWKGLGYETPGKISYTGAGIEFEELYINLEHRVSAAKAASKYLYSEKKAVELATGETGIKIEIIDYISGKK